MEAKVEAPNVTPVVKNEIPNQPKQQQMQGGGPSGKFNNNNNNQGGGNKFNNANPRQNNKNFQPKGNRGNMPIGMNRGPPKGEVTNFLKM